MSSFRQRIMTKLAHLLVLSNRGRDAIATFGGALIIAAITIDLLHHTFYGTALFFLFGLIGFYCIFIVAFLGQEPYEPLGSASWKIKWHMWRIKVRQEDLKLNEKANTKIGEEIEQRKRKIQELEKKP